MKKAPAILLLFAVASLAFAADAKVVFSKDISPNGAGFDSVNSVVSISLSEAISEGKTKTNVAQATILVKGSKFDNTCFKAELTDVKDASGKKVIDKKLTITYYTTCQTCESDNRVQIALASQLDKLMEFGFRINCAADTVFVSNGKQAQSVLNAIADYALRMTPELVKHVNVRNANALSDGTNRPFANAINFDSGEAIRDSRISYIKEKLMAGSKSKTLIIIGNPAPPTSVGTHLSENAGIKDGYFPLIKKKLAAPASADIPAWEFDVPIDRLYDADWAAVVDTGSFAGGDYMIVSRIPGYPNDPALSAGMIENFLGNARNGAVTVGREPLVIADSSGGSGSYIRNYAETAAPEILTAGTSSPKFMFAPAACKASEDNGASCRYDALKTALGENNNFLSITHGNGKELGASKAGVWYSVLTVSVKDDVKPAPLFVAGTNCFESALDCATEKNSQSCIDLTPSRVSDSSLVRALGNAGTLLLMGHSRTSIYTHKRVSFKGRDNNYNIPNPVIEMLLYARDRGATIGEAFNNVDIGYLKASMPDCKAKLSAGIELGPVEKNVDRFCDASSHEPEFKLNLYGVNLIGIPKVKVA